MIINLNYLNGGGGTGSGVTPSEVNALINSAITEGQYINNAEYISSAKTIVLYQDSTEVATIDATAFIKDGMVDSVTVSGSILTIVFNTDAGKEPINVDLSDVVDLSNYYTKTDVDAIASGKADSSAVTQSLTSKQDTLISGTNIKTLNNESLLGSGNITISGGGGSNIIELTQAEYDALVSGGTVDPDALYIISDAEEVNLSGYALSSAVTAEISAAVSGKADSSALSAYTLQSNFVTHSGNTNIHTTSAEKEVWNGKQDALRFYTEDSDGLAQIAVDESSGIQVYEGWVNIVSNGTEMSIWNTGVAIDGDEVVTSSQLDDYYTSAQTESAITQAVSSYQPITGMSAYTQEANFVTHSGNTIIHTTAQEKTLWNGKQDALVSGTNIKTLNNESLLGSGNITISGGGVSSAEVETMISEAVSGKADSSAVTQSLTSKQDTLISGTNIKTINSQSLLGSGNIDIQGGGATYSAGTNISIDTANTISCTLPITAGTYGTSVAIGLRSQALNGASLAVGQDSQTNGGASAAIGDHCQTKNTGEFACGFYNTSITGTSNTNRTLFSVGNGTADNARKNALEIRQNGDIYITSGGTDIKLQDNLGGGGGSYQYYSEDTSGNTANIDIQTDDGEGNTAQYWLGLGGGSNTFGAVAETDDGEGNTTSNDGQINIDPIGGVTISASNSEGGQTTDTILTVESTGVTINGDNVVTEAAFDYDPITSALTITFLNA